MELVIVIVVVFVCHCQPLYNSFSMPRVVQDNNRKIALIFVVH